MIFLSHTHSDKPKVEPIAERLRAIFGKDQVFYDSWSIQPGEGIIDRMNAGLASTTHFFFFVSKASLDSDMVKLEWQNAVFMAAGQDTKIIPIRLDDCAIPPIIKQLRYIDYYGQGPDVALRQIVDMASGREVYTPGETGERENVIAYISRTEKGLLVEIRAELFMEPFSTYYFLFPAGTVGVRECIHTAGFSAQGIHRKGFLRPFGRVNEQEVDALRISRPTPTAPGTPFTVELWIEAQPDFPLVGVFRAVSDKEIKQVPMLSTDHVLLDRLRRRVGQ